MGKVGSIAKKTIMSAVVAGYKMISPRIKVDDKTILFISFNGRGYSDNPKALHQYMSSRPEFADYHMIWAMKNGDEKIPNAEVVKYRRWGFFVALAKSKYWIVNFKMPRFVLKKPNQVYLQTWHGTPLKRLAHDIIVPEGTTFYRTGMSETEMHGTYDEDVAKYNYMISPNGFCTEVFQSAFQINRERLIETGYPRNDILVQNRDNQEKIIELKNKFGLPQDKKIILYAPTWRDNSFNISGYTFELKVDFHKWKEKLGDDYAVIFKPHYLIVNHFKDDPSLDGFLYNIEANVDINELYLVSDALVTDYSSVFFDYANMNRPIYFYMYDIEEYKNELRGFYLDIYQDLPGGIIDNEDVLLQAILDENPGGLSLEEFNKRFNHCEDGHASERVINILMGK